MSKSYMRTNAAIHRARLVAGLEDMRHGRVQSLAEIDAALASPAPQPAAPAPAVGEAAPPFPDQCEVGESMASDYFEHAAECPECEAHEAARVARVRAATPPTGEAERLREALDDVACRLDHMIRYRHETAHNGDIYEGGSYDICPLCKETREAIASARAALASPAPQPAAPEAVWEALADQWDTKAVAIRAENTTQPYSPASCELAGRAWQLHECAKQVRAALASPAPQPAENDGSVMVRIDRVYVDAMRGDGLTGPFACVRLVEHDGEPRLELTTAPVPTPDTAEWWREVAQGLGVEIAKLKALVSAPACVASTPQGDVCGLCGRASADHRGPENAAAPAPVEPPTFATGGLTIAEIQRKLHIGTAQAMRVQSALYPDPPASPRLRGGGISSHAEIEDARKAQE